MEEDVWIRSISSEEYNIEHSAYQLNRDSCIEQKRHVFPVFPEACFNTQNEDSATAAGNRKSVFRPLWSSDSERANMAEGETHCTFENSVQIMHSGYQ